MATPLSQLPQGLFEFIRHSDNSVTRASQASKHDAHHLATVNRIAGLLMQVRGSDKGFLSRNLALMVNGEARTYIVRAYFNFDREVGEYYITDIEVENLQRRAGSIYMANYRCYRDGGVTFSYNWGITNNILEQVADMLEAAIGPQL